MKRLILVLILVGAFLFSCNKTEKNDEKDAGLPPNIEAQDVKQEEKENTKKSEDIPNIQFLDTKKMPVVLYDLLEENKETLVFVMVEWCSHCNNQAKILQEFYEKNKEKFNFLVIYSNNQTNFEKTQKYLKENNFTFPLYYDKDNILLDVLNVQAFPSFFLFDGKKVKEQIEGPISYEQLEEYSKK